MPRAPTHLDLTDDTGDNAGLDAPGSEFNAIDLEPAAPEVGRRRNKPGGAANRTRAHTPSAPPERRADVRPAAPTEDLSEKADPRLPQAQDDALRLALQIRAALGKGQTNTFMICGIEPGQTVRRLTRELALAFVQLREAPVLIVDLEPGDATEERYEFSPLPEIDSSTWLEPGPRGRPSAAVLCPPKRQPGRRRSFATSGQFSRNLEGWRTQAALVICCARSVPDSIATLTAGASCGAAVLVVPGTESTHESVVAARDICTRSGMTLLGCVIDQTPADPAIADR